MVRSVVSIFSDNSQLPNISKLIFLRSLDIAVCTRMSNKAHLIQSSGTMLCLILLRHLLLRSEIVCCTNSVLHGNAGLEKERYIVKGIDIIPIFDTLE